MMMASQSTMQQLQARPKAQFTSPRLGATSRKSRRPALARKQACHPARAAVRAAADAGGRARSDGNIGEGNDVGGWFSGRDAPLTPDATVDLPALTGVSKGKGGGGLGVHLPDVHSLWRHGMFE